MLKLGLKNFRRLRSVDPIDIRPITLLVGKNSIGKSSFLRTLPLFKQSTMTRSSATVLWYGDFVDFGNFTTTVNDNDIEKEITFTFVINNVSDRPRSGTYLSAAFEYEEDNPSFIELRAAELTINVRITGDSLATRLGGVDIFVKDLNLFGAMTVDKANRVRTLVVDGVDIAPMLRTSRYISNIFWIIAVAACN